MTALVLAALLAATPSQAEARAIDAEVRAQDVANRLVNPFEATNAEPFADMETAAERGYREWLAWQMISEFQARTDTLTKP